MPHTGGEWRHLVDIWRLGENCHARAAPLRLSGPIARRNTAAPPRPDGLARAGLVDLVCTAIFTPHPHSPHDWRAGSQAHGYSGPPRRISSPQGGAHKRAGHSTKCTAREHRSNGHKKERTNAHVSRSAQRERRANGTRGRHDFFLPDGKIEHLQTRGTKLTDHFATNLPL
jgi:hypothetical protein